MNPTTVIPRLFKSAKGRPDRAKPPQKTILRFSTARSMAYLQARGLADFTGSTAIVAQRKMVKILSNGLRLLVDLSGCPSYGV